MQTGWLQFWDSPWRQQPRDSSRKKITSLLLPGAHSPPVCALSGPSVPRWLGPGRGHATLQWGATQAQEKWRQICQLRATDSHTSAASAQRLLGSVAARGEGRVAGVGSRLLGSAPVPGDEAGGLQNPTCQGTGRFNTLGAKRSRRIIQIQILLFQLTLIVLPGVTSSFDHP